MAHDTLVAADRVGDVPVRRKVVPPDEDDMAFDTGQIKEGVWVSSAGRAAKKRDIIARCDRRGMELRFDGGGLAAKLTLCVAAVWVAHK